MSPSILAVSWEEELYSRRVQSNPAFRATRPMCSEGWHRNRGKDQGDCVFSRLLARRRILYGRR